MEIREIDEDSKEELNSKIKMHIDEAEKNMFRDDAKRRYKMERRNKSLVILGVLLFLFYLICVFLPNGLDQNNVYLSATWYLNMIVDNVKTFAYWLSGNAPGTSGYKYSQYIIVAFVGAALATSGAVFQGAFRNALASPTTLGVETGGVLGGTIYVFNSSSELIALEDYGFIDAFGRSFAILIGCLFMVILVMNVARMLNKSKYSTLGLILSGVVFAGAVAEVLSLIQYRMLLTNTFDSRTYVLREMMMGTFSRAFSMQHLFMICIPLAVGIGIILILRTRLNLLVFGEEEAKTMGINVNIIRYGTIIVVTILTAMVISFCGMISFLGFIVPHVARRVVGPDFRFLIPASMLIGGIVMMIIFHIASAIGLASNINLMTSLIGGCIFMIMIIWFRRRGHADWA